jgi:hypothetical protein
MTDNEVTNVPNECELGEVHRSNRGFQYVEFIDRSGRTCGLQQSSAIGDYDDAMERPGSSFIWLGIEGPGLGRMHLNRMDVAALIETLGRWLDTGSFIWKEETGDEADEVRS